MSTDPRCPNCREEIDMEAFARDNREALMEAMAVRRMPDFPLRPMLERDAAGATHEVWRLHDPTAAVPR